MQMIYKKRRPAEYKYELENEYKRLKIAKDSFCQLLTPQKFELKNSTLFTERIGAGDSTCFKQQYPPGHFIKEYIKIIFKLWDEKLDTEIDLTPEWLKSPNLENRSHLHPDFKSKTKKELLKILQQRPTCASEDLRVVHGDLCPVNIVFDNDGHAIGVIDLGDMHIGDKMLDIAVLSWTIRGNFGKKYENMFLNELEINPHDKKLEYYRLVYDLSLPNYKKWDWIKE